jgi:hypothetical protein
MEAASCSEMLITIYQTVLCQILEDSNPQFAVVKIMQQKSSYI